MGNTILSIARTALTAQRKAMEISSNNLSNSGTEGYTRQRAILTPQEATPLPSGMYGSGVQVENVQRVRDGFLDASFREQASSASYSKQRSDLLARVEGALNEPSDSGLSATLDAFWSAWSDLANDPTSSTARSAVQERGRQVAETFHQIDARLDDSRAAAESRLEGQVRTLNEKAERIAELNSKIVSEESGGITAPNLRDQRDLALDEMSDVVDLKVSEQENGSVTVFTDGLNLVDGNDAEALEAKKNGSGDFELQVKGSSRTISGPGGSAGAIMDFLNDTLPGYVSDLDKMAENLVTETNSIHHDGIPPELPAGASDPDPDIDFFDTADSDALEAGGIELSDAIEADEQHIAAGSGDDTATHPDSYRAGNNDIALEMADLRDKTLAALNDKSFNGFYSDDIVGQVGVDASEARKRSEADSALLSQIETRRARKHGVSTDEEMIDLVRHQQAFTAAARMVTTADEMMQTVLDMKR